MGGACAAHLGRKGLVDFVLCDRTFGQLQEVPKYSMGAWAQVGIRVLLEWDTDSSQDFFYTNCYKVIAQDACDALIGEHSSMKNKVSSLVLEKDSLQKKLWSKVYREEIEVMGVLSQEDTKDLF
jgi:hypothetical protein